MSELRSGLVGYAIEAGVGLCWRRGEWECGSVRREAIVELAGEGLRVGIGSRGDDGRLSRMRRIREIVGFDGCARLNTIRTGCKIRRAVQVVSVDEGREEDGLTRRLLTW